MKISQARLKLNDYATAVLNRRLFYHNPNVYTLALYSNYKTTRLNDLYITLLPVKITRLNRLKARLNGLLNYYKQNIQLIQDKPEFRLKTGLNGLSKNLIREMTDLGLLDSLNGLNSEFKQYDEISRFMTAVKYMLNRIDKAISRYKTHLDKCPLIYDGKKLRYRRKTGFNLFSYHISEYDLTQLKDGKITQAVKEMYYFYMIMFKKAHNSKTTTAYLNNILIKKAINQYCDSDIIGDFKTIIKPDLDGFRSWFLDKVL